MKGKTPWETAAASEGNTPSEGYLATLARKVFLSLWSYANLFTDEGRSRGKGDGKELCDLLVVFGNNVLIFSDKHCEFPTHPDIMVSWSRWYKRAVEKSARQLAGAEKFLRAYPTRIFLDRNCQARLPISLPHQSVARYFLIAVTRGSYDASAKFWGGSSSGSLVLDNTIVGASHYHSPFKVGFPLSDRRFLHLLDEMTVNIVLEELDTVPDLIAYLECKEAYFNQPGFEFSAAGEEQLLARYMCTLREGKHSLPVIPNGHSTVFLAEGDWEFYSVSPQREAKKAADAGSYMWDGLIEYQSSFIRAGTATSLLDSKMSADSHEQIVRALADESRLSRRQLTANLRHALSQNEPGKKFARVVVSGQRRERAYVFLAIPKPLDTTYEEYRQMRADVLFTYCSGIKTKFPWVTEAVGIASEPMAESVSSQDFLFADLSGEALSAKETSRLNEVMAELDVLQSPTFNVINGKAHEFPLPFDFSDGPDSFSYTNRFPMNRADRRATAKRARRKRH